MATAIKDKTKKSTASKKKAVAKDKTKRFLPVIPQEDETDPRHILFEAYYTNPNSPTFSNALRSAIKAGYTESYGRNILDFRPQWLLEIMGRMESKKMMLQARKNLDADLNMEVMEQAMGAFGPIFTADENGKKTIPVMMRNIKAVEARQKATFFVSEKIDPLFNKSQKDNNNSFKIDFKQIIIVNPNGSNNDLKVV